MGPSIWKQQEVPCDIKRKPQGFPSSYIVKLQKKKLKKKNSFQKLLRTHLKRKCHLTRFFCLFSLKLFLFTNVKSESSIFVSFFYYVRDFLEMFLVLSIKNLLNFCLVLFFFILTNKFCLSHQQTNTIGNKK